MYNNDKSSNLVKTRLNCNRISEIIDSLGWVEKCDSNIRDNKIDVHPGTFINRK